MSTSKEDSPNNNDDDDITALHLCFGSPRILNIILDFLRYHKYAIFMMRRVSKKFNVWVRPFVFSHLNINYTKYQEYISQYLSEKGRPFPFTPQRIVVDQLLKEVPPTVTQITLHRIDGWTDSINASNITHLLLHFETYKLFDSSLDNLPSSLTYLELPLASFPKHSLTKLPPSLTYIEEFKKSIDILPPSLIHLKFEETFHSPLDRLPQSIKTIWFPCGSAFNQKVDNLPHSLKKIEFGGLFDKTVDHLPPSLTWIRFGRNFNQRVDNLPSSITRIEFGYDFNQRVDNLPQSLTHLMFGRFFNHPVDSLPSKLKCLSFGTEFNQPIDKLPSSLIALSIYYTPHQADIPPVTSLLIGKKLDSVKFPNSVTHLGFWGTFNEPIKGLPESITHLSTRGDFNRSIKKVNYVFVFSELKMSFSKKKCKIKCGYR